MGAAHLVVDLTGLAYIDASCVQVLWRVSRMVEGAGGRLGLAAPQPPVARVMELWGARQVFGVHDSVAEAVIAAAGWPGHVIVHIRPWLGRRPEVLNSGGAAPDPGSLVVIH
jgi:hypothetical protein